MNLLEKTHLICFATPSHFQRQANLVESAKRFGIKNIYAYTNLDLGEEWHRLHKEHLKHPENIAGAYSRIYGYGSWKAHIILETIKKNQIPENDIIFYCDSDTEIISSIEPLLEIVEKEKFLCFSVNGCTEVEWSKADTEKAILGFNPETEIIHFRNNEERKFSFKNSELNRILLSDQYWTAYFFFKNNRENWEIITEWDVFMSDYYLVSDTPSRLRNLPVFKEHRHDQTILSLLLKKKGIEPYRDPGDFGINHCMENSTYSQIFTFRNDLR